MKNSRLPNTSIPITMREARRKRSCQLFLTVWAMDWSPTDLRASLKILMILAILKTCMILPALPRPDSSSSFCRSVLAFSRSMLGGGSRKRVR